MKSLFLFSLVLMVKLSYCYAAQTDNQATDSIYCRDAETNNQLIEAVKTHNMTEIGRLLAKHHITARDDDGRTILHHIAASASPLPSQYVLTLIYPFISSILAMGLIGLTIKIVVTRHVSILTLWATAITAFIVIMLDRFKDMLPALLVRKQDDRYGDYMSFMFFLHQSGLNINQPDKTGKTPFQHVLESQDQQAIINLAYHCSGATVSDIDLQEHVSNFFEIQGNVPLVDAKIILLGEAHDDIHYRLMNYRVIRKLLKEKAVILLEGEDRDSEFPCFEQLKTALCPALGLCNELQCKLECDRFMEYFVADKTFWEQSVCKGWEIKSAALATSLLIFPTRLLSLLGSFFDSVFKKISLTTKLEDWIWSLGCKIFIDIRNQGIIQGIEDALKDGAQQVYVVAGSKHLPFDSPEGSYEYANTKNLREYLALKKYAILRKKHTI